MPYKEYTKKRRRLHYLLGIRTMKEHPSLFGFIVLILIITLAFWLYADLLSESLTRVKLLRSAFPVAFHVLGIFLPVLLFLGLIAIIGYIASKKSEESITLAFSHEDLVNGAPILVKKYRAKGCSSVIVREWYSFTPLYIWKKNSESIQDMFDEYLVNELFYGTVHGDIPNGRIIKMQTVKGRKPTPRGDIHDEYF